MAYGAMDDILCTEAVNALPTLLDRLEAFHAKPVAGEVPTGAIVNGREFLRRLAEHYTFECEAGSLAECYEYTEAVRCFEHMAEHIAAYTSQPLAQDDRCALIARLQDYRSDWHKRMGDVSTLDAAIAALQSPPPVVSPLPEPVASAELGLYRVHWRSGGSSLAAIGMQSDGSRWLAPTNWVAPAMHDAGNGWAEIASLERIQPEPEDCPHCQGEGTIEHPFLTGAYGGSHAIDPLDPVIVECEDCHGTGKVESDD